MAKRLVTLKRPSPEETLREFPPIGKYRIRLLRDPRKPEKSPVLDIREHVSAEGFEGFTRRGIRLGDRAQVDLLRDILKMVLESERPGFGAAGEDIH